MKNLFLIVIILIGIIIAYNYFNDDTPKVNVLSADAQSQESFHATLKQYNNSYEQQPNDIKKGDVYTDANNWMTSFAKKHEWTFENWTGRIERLRTITGGEALRLSIISDVGSFRIKYSNSDLFGSIDKGTKVYNQVRDLKQGQEVLFSGKFEQSSNRIKESSWTESGSMSEPEFSITFINVSPKDNAEHIDELPESQSKDSGQVQANSEIGNAANNSPESSFVNSAIPLQENITIVSFAEQRALAKNLLTKISDIQRPAIDAIKDYQNALKAYSNHQGTAQSLIYYASTARAYCDGASSQYSDLKIPNGFHSDTLKLFQDGIENLRKMYSDKYFAFGNTIKGIQTGDNNELEYAKENFSEGENHFMSALANIGKLYAYFNLTITEDNKVEFKNDTTTEK